MKRPLVFVSLVLFTVSLLPIMATAQAQKFNIDTPVDGYFTPTDFPCLPETIHSYGIIHEQIVYAPSKNLAHYTIHQGWELTVVGMDSGQKYIFAGPMTSTATFEAGNDVIPFELTINNANHFIGPGQFNLFIHEVMHGLIDPETGDAKLWFDKFRVSCK